MPQIFIGETHVGGCDDLYELERQGKLDALLQGASFPLILTEPCQRATPTVRKPPTSRSSAWKNSTCATSRSRSSTRRNAFERETPNIDVQLATAATRLDEGFFDVTLTVTVTAKIGQDKTLFIEAAQAGIFQIRNVPEENLEPLLFVACPNLLYPYAREAITSSSLRRFQPVILAPVNFEALYAQQKRQAELAQSGEGEARLQ